MTTETQQAVVETAQSASNSLEEALQAIIMRTLDGVDAATQFLGEEIPDVVSQALLWYGTYHFLMLLGSLVVFGVGCYIIKLIKDNWINEYKGKKDRWHDLHTPENHVALGVIWSIIFVLISCVMFNLTWLKIWIAPKLWLIEYAATLVSK